MDEQSPGGLGLLPPSLDLGPDPLHSRASPTAQQRQRIRYSAGDVGLIPGLERSPGGGNGNPLQYSCRVQSHGQKSLAATVHGVTKSLSTLQSITLCDAPHT